MDAMRSIQVLNAINELGLIVVVHHTGKSAINSLPPPPNRWYREEACSLETHLFHQTDCGTTHVKDSEVRESIKKSNSRVPVDAMQFGEINE